MRGDVFAMQLPDSRYLFGRVIEAELSLDQAPMPGVYLIYIYKQRTNEKTPPMGLLTPDRLLLPPIFINRLPWSRGYFETVASGEVRPEDVLPQHCFLDVTGRYFDLGWKILPGPTEPCGGWYLHSYQIIDEEIGDALGYPRAPEANGSDGA